VQPTGLDILDRGVDLLGRRRDLVDRRLVEIEGDPLGLEQRLALLDQARLGLGQDVPEVAAVERLLFDLDRQPFLQFGKQVGGLGWVEGAGGDEQDVVGLDGAVTCSTIAHRRRPARPLQHAASRGSN